MDTTKAQTPKLETATIADESRTVAESPGATKALAAADIRDHELIRRIGQGSYGEVWLARNVMGTYRAVKIVYRAAFEHARPFEREFNGIQKFEPLSRSHEGFVDILQIGRTEDYFYYVMELADDVTAGPPLDPNRYEPKTLRSVQMAQTTAAFGDTAEVAGEKSGTRWNASLPIARGRLPFEQCVELGLSLTQALGKLHSHGLIHRDIKPSNIIFVNGIPKLADIGLVAAQSEAKSFVGTEGFIPPEGPGTPQADIYSLGKVLYEIATGKDRHEFPNLPTLLGERETDTQLLELNIIFLKACQSDLKQRYQTAEQMRDDLLLLQGGKSVKRAQAVEKRLALLSRLSAATVVVIVLVSAALYVAHRQTQREARLRQDAEQQRQRAELSELAARRNAYAADMTLASLALETGNWADVRTLLERHSPKDQPPSSATRGNDLRGWEWRYLWVKSRGDELFTLGFHDTAVFGVTFSADGNRLASMDIHHRVKLWDFENRQVLASAILHSNRIQRLAFSRDGRFLVTASLEGTLKISDARTLEAAGQLAHEGPVDDFAFTQDGTRLLSIANFQAIVWNWPQRRELRRFSLSGMNRSAPLVMALSSDDRTFAVVAADERIWLWDLEREKPIGQLTGHESSRFWGREIWQMTFSADGHWLATAGSDHTARVWDVRGMKQAAVLKHASLVNAVAFSRDGRTLATGTRYQLLKLWDWTNQSELITYRGHHGSVFTVTFSPDGSQIVSGGRDYAVRVWSAKPEEKHDPMVRLPPDVRGAKFLSGNKHLITWTTNWPPAMSLWNLTNMHLIRHFAAVTNTANVLFSPLGDRRAIYFNDGSLFVENVETGGRTMILEASRGADADLFWSPDGTRLLALKKGQALLFRTDNGRELLRLEPSIQRWSTAALSADNTLFVIAGDFGPSEVFELNKGTRRVLSGHDGSVPSIAFTPDNRQFATASTDGTIKLWAPDSSEPVAILRSRTPGYTAAALSADGTRLVTGSIEDGLVQVWDMETKRELAAFKGHSAPVVSVTFVDENTIASCGLDAVRFWRAPSFQEIESRRASNLSLENAAPSQARGVGARN